MASLAGRRSRAALGLCATGIASEFGVRGYPTIKLALIRPLPSQQMFEHVQKRHRVFFVYIGGESPLKYVTLKEMPAVLVFKDETYFVYDEYEDGDLSAWINRERFQNYLTMDGFLLYELGDTGKLVAIAVIDEKNTSVEHTSELTVPTVVVLNTSNQQYFLLDRQISDAKDMVQFINNVLDGTVESIFKSSPLMGCFLFGLPLGVISIMCYGIYTADTDGGYIEERYEVSKSELESQEQAEESTEQEPSGGGSLAPTAQEPKDVLEKKKD
ncbi:Protein disulfide-isomerase TMX3 [Sciurus carolinensis]|uniref:protein disulfide-isomerase n=1 Tax=Sciurus carolinensis TaxID=30640 RepID=A0AA41NBG9_SCICA|nr:Protein disulfide-isomerase TMX3 [Sciurus carolinensis]